MKRAQVIELNINHIMPNPNQPRQIFNQESLEELAKSIKEHGLIQPVIVRIRENGGYELIAGERRLRASKIAGLNHIPAIIRSITIQDSAYLALIENIQRDDLHFIEVAKSYIDLMDEYKLTQTELVEIVGKSQSSIANKIRILNLPNEILALLLQHNLSERHARALLRCKDEGLQFKILKHIIKHDLNVRESENYIEKQLEKEEKHKVKRTITPFLKDIRLFTNTIKQTVETINQSGMNATYQVQEEEDKYRITIDIPIER